MAPLATGPGAIAVGIGTKATATASAAFGKGITANETESLALSAIAYAKNFYFDGDPRLVEDVQDVEPSSKHGEAASGLARALTQLLSPPGPRRRGLRARSLRGAPRGQGAV